MGAFPYLLGKAASSRSMTFVHLRWRVHHDRKPERRETIRWEHHDLRDQPRFEELPAPEPARWNRRAGTRKRRPPVAGWRRSQHSEADQIVRSRILRPSIA